MADAHTNTSADLHSVPDVYPVAYTNSYALPDTESRSYIHTVPDLHAMAYVDTDTCAYRHGGAYPNADSDCANTDTGADGYGDTDRNTGSDSHGSADSYTDSRAKFVFPNMG